MTKPGTFAACALLLLTAPPTPAADPVDSEDLRYGLVATFGDGQREAVRLEPTVALNLAKGEAAHPRLAASGDTVRWQGYANLLRAGQYRFRANLVGQLRVTVGGKEVFNARSNSPTVPVEAKAVQLESGVQSVEAVFTRTEPAARVELFWEGPGFRDEPLPADALGHLPAKLPAEFRAHARTEHGRFLAEERNCVGCHRPSADDRMGQGLRGRVGPDLTAVGGRAFAGWIDAWLADPQKIRPGTMMPKVFAADDAGRAERYAVAVYLASQGGPLAAEPAPPLARVKDNIASASRGEAVFVTAGCVACHQNDPAKLADASGSLHGLGAATGPQSNYPLGELGEKTTPAALAKYLANPLAVNPSGRMPNMVLQGNEAADLARYLCGRKSETPPKFEAPPAERLAAVWEAVNPPADEAARLRKLPAERQWLEAGKRLVTVRGCDNCHTVTAGGKVPGGQPAAASLTDLQRLASPRGCLDEKPAAGRVPDFRLTRSERESLGAFLKDGLAGAGSPAATYEARAALKRFNCLNCHQRDGEGGLSTQLIEQLRSREKVENADAVTPPPLTGVGHKLRTPWLKQVLTSTGRARPWMGLRMPQYGEANVGFLAHGLAALEGAAPDDTVHKFPLTGEKVATGRALIGKSGLGCISCHDIAGIPNSGTRGPDLATTDQRVRYDWYRRWLEQPQKMQPGTRMPQVFPEGKSLLTAVYGGHADRQSEAMWAYLSLGPDLPLPDGLEPPKGPRQLVLAAKDRPEVLRTFMPDAGAKAIAVGYPGGVSVAFDAAACRLAYAWSGNFLDAAPVWDNRGGSPAKLLGPKFWAAPPGHPWALGDAPPDFAARAREPAYGAGLGDRQIFQGKRLVHFDGYGTVEGGEPVFRYRLELDQDPGAVLSVAERPGPLRSGVATGLARRFTLEVPARQAVWFQAGVTGREPKLYDGAGNAVVLDLKADRPEASAADLLVLPQDGGRATVLAVPGAAGDVTWQFRRQGGGWRALLRLAPAAEAGRRQLMLHVWGLAREEPGLVKELAVK